MQREKLAQCSCKFFTQTADTDTASADFSSSSAPYAEQQYLKCLWVSGNVHYAYVITLNKAYQLSKLAIGIVKYIGST